MSLFSTVGRAAAAIYISVGVLLALFHPQLDTTEALIATKKGKSCGVAHGLALTFLWPFYLNYYYGGGFDACRRSL
jgi:hypothetical protein